MITEHIKPSDLWLKVDPRRLYVRSSSKFEFSIWALSPVGDPANLMFNEDCLGWVYGRPTDHEPAVAELRQRIAVYQALMT